MKSDPASVLPPVTSTSLTRRLIPHPRRRFNQVVVIMMRIFLESAGKDRWKENDNNVGEDHDYDENNEDDGNDNDYDGDVRNDEDIKPDDSDADPGVTVSPIVARWQVCRALNRNC